MKKPVAIVLHGPSGVGKDTIIDILRERIGIHRPTSTTSRPPRPGEADGKHYHFVTPAEFLDRVERHEFVERALVYGDLKGLERIEVEQPLQAGKDIIIRTDVQGARRWRELLEGAVFVFLTAESEDVLRRRLVERATEDNESLERRFAELEDELADIPNNDYVVVNRRDHVDEAVKELIEIIERERANEARPAPKLRPTSRPGPS
jgi:guanylate kinase